MVTIPMVAKMIGIWTRRTILIVVLMLSSILLVSCGSTLDQASDDTGNSAVVEADHVLKIGVVTSLAGPFADLGAEMVRSVEFAASEANGAGGVLGNKVEVMVADSQGTTEGALRAAERLVRQEGIRFIFGPITTPENIAIGQTIGAWGGILITGTPKAPNVTGKDLTRYLFRPGHNDTQEILTAEAFVKSGGLKGLKSWYVFGADYEWGRSAVNEFKRMASENGLEIVGEAYAPTSTKDFAPYIADIAAKQPDGLWVAFSGSNAVDILSQAIAFGLPEKVQMFGVGFATDAVLNVVGPKAEGLMGVIDYHWSFDNPENKRFVENWMKTNDLPPSTYEMEEYLGVRALFEAMETAGTTTDAEAIIDALEGLTMPSPHGVDVTMRAGDHQMLAPTYIGRVKADASAPKGWTMEILYTAPTEECNIPVEQTGSAIIEQVKAAGKDPEAPIIKKR